MSEFSHSVVLFCGEDGLPLEFNIRNTREKALLKAVIEHGSGICNQSENAIYLISPGTKILNADLGKKLVSTKYIFDCVEQNYLLDVDDYVSTIAQARTSDISDESNSTPAQPPNHSPTNEMYLDPFPHESAFTFAPNLVINHQNSTSSESFVEDSLKQDSASNTSGGFTCYNRPLTSTEKIINDDDVMDFTCLDGISPISEINKPSKEAFDKSKTVSNLVENPETSQQTVVSSSQPDEEQDEFDKMLLNKSQQLNVDKDKDSLSQSYTVSSSADVLSSKSNSGTDKDKYSNEILSVTDSPLLLSNSEIISLEDYIKCLEAEVEAVLQKPSPKSIQDKICLVKYICVVKKLPPATVLQLHHML